MRILVVHNAYQQRGGEDSVVAAEVALLRRHGHDVVEYLRHNDEIAQLPAWRVASGTVWAPQAGRDLRDIVRQGPVDIVHCHNTFPLISPSLYWAARSEGLPVVQTLHNFRLMCPQAMLLRDAQVCEDCVGRLPWRSVVHACYRGSRLQSAAITCMLGAHRALGTYTDKVNAYIALNEFCRQKFIEGGLPASRLFVKPNFVDRPSAPAAGPREGFLYVGRLSTEKGISVIASALQQVDDIDLRVAGTGPESGQLAGLRGVAMLGSLTAEQVDGEMLRSQALVMPSVWYENYPRTLVEAFACGLPVIASRIGALAELVKHGETGLLFEPGDPQGLAGALAWARSHPDEMRSMGMQARAHYERHLGAEQNYAMLMDIYARARADVAQVARIGRR